MREKVQYESTLLENKARQLFSFKIFPVESTFYSVSIFKVMSPNRLSKTWIMFDDKRLGRACLVLKLETPRCCKLLYPHGGTFQCFIVCVNTEGWVRKGICPNTEVKSHVWMSG